MDKKIAGLLGAAAALATVGGANAATEVQGTPQNPATSYRELLNPVPNATAALKADDARRDAEARNVKTAQVTVQFGHHHHHHHHHGVRIRMGHHHHHHHARYHHHHHHHHSSYYSR
jgi:hypothetical protein